MEFHSFVRLSVFALTWVSGFCFGHEVLYYTAEIHLSDPATIRVHFSLHAPEILLDPDTDFSDIGDKWLRSLSDLEITELIKKSRAFIAETYQIDSRGGNAVTDFPLVFESADLIRETRREGGPRPGCILASLSFPNPGGQLNFVYSDHAEKRLLLAIIRPRAFPKTFDLEPGSIREITLPDPPPRPGKPLAQWLVFVTLPLLFLIAVLLRPLYRRRAEPKISNP